jgi:hypothetical protein
MCAHTSFLTFIPSFITMFAEHVSLEQLRSTSGYEFSDWIAIGTTNEKGELSLKTNITPWNVKGLYIHAFEHNGVFYPFYAGKSAAREQGVNHRIRCEYHVAQNTGLRANGAKRHAQGPYVVNKHLVEKHAITANLFVSVFSMDAEDTKAIEIAETALLSKFDFIANYTFNGKRRIEDLDVLIKPVAPVEEAAVAPSAAPAPSVFNSMTAVCAKIDAEMSWLESALASHASHGFSNESVKLSMNARLKELAHDRSIFAKYMSA